MHLSHRTIFAMLCACFVQVPACLAQSSAEMESLLKASKLVDTKHELRVTPSVGGEVVISTYCSNKASDRDCKITALLMLKELSQHYKNVVQVRASFYDEVAASKYRTVVVNSRHAQLLDSGKQITEVLATIPIAAGTVQNSSNYSSVSARPGAYYRQRQEMSREIKDLIDRGARPNHLIDAMSRFEQACQAPSPDPRTCANMYRTLLSELDQQEAATPRKQTQTTSQASVTDTLSRSNQQEMIERIKTQIINSGGDTSSITTTIQEIERRVRK